MPYKLSPSSLHLFKECPRCFWLDKHAVWKRPEGIVMSLPNGMDRVIKSHFDSFRDKGLLPPELEAYNLSKDIVLFSDHEKLRVWRNNLQGIRYVNERGDILFGAVDNILAKGNKLIVLDYKTRGFALKETTTSHYQHQMDIYNFLLRENGYTTEDYGYLLFYIPREVVDHGTVKFDTELVTLTVHVEDAEELFTRALKLLYGDCPQQTCSWCEHV